MNETTAAITHLPPLPEEHEVLYYQTLARVKEIAAKLKEQRLGVKGGGSAGERPAIGEDGEPIAAAPARTRETFEMMVPTHRAGLVIGHHGENLKRIEKMAQVRIQFEQGYGMNEPERKVTITGLPEDIDEAKRLIMEKVEENQPRFPTIIVNIPNYRVGQVIGRGGETIRELQEKSGAKVNVAPDGSADPHTGERAITIMGDDESIRRARDLLDEIVYGLTRPGTAPSLTTVKNSKTITIPDQCVGGLIGKQAVTLRQIQQLSNTKVFVEPQGTSRNNLRSVHLSGTPEAIAYAEHLVNENVAQQQIEAQGFYSNYEAQPDVIYQAPGEFTYGAQQSNGTLEGQPASYDYAQYYAQYYAGQPYDLNAAQLDPNAQYYAGQQHYDPNAPQVDPAVAAEQYAAYYAQYGQQSNDPYQAQYSQAPPQ